MTIAAITGTYVLHEHTFSCQPRISAAADRLSLVKQIATLRMTQVAAKVGENAPLTAVCCNACRTCVTTNIVGLATAGLAGAGFAVSRFVKRLVGR
jgi:hypothetical protein